MDRRAPVRSGSLTTRSRDVGVRALARLRRGLAVGCVALIGGLAAFVAQAKPGKSTDVAAASTQPQTGSNVRFAQKPLTAVPSSAPSSSLSPPPQAPTAVPAAPAPATPAPAAPPPVVSGAS